MSKEKTSVKMTKKYLGKISAELRPELCRYQKVKDNFRGIETYYPNLVNVMYSTVDGVRYLFVRIVNNSMFATDENGKKTLIAKDGIDFFAFNENAERVKLKGGEEFDPEAIPEDEQGKDE